MKPVGLSMVLAGLLVSGGLKAQTLWNGQEIPDDARIIGAQVITQSPSGSYLGVGVAEINAERAKAMKLKEVRGVEITRVENDSPAAKAGLKVGDVVLEYNGERVEGTAQFQRMVRETPADRQVRLVISRDGTTQTLTTTVGQRNTGFGMSQADMDRLKSQMDRLQQNLRLRVPDVPRPLMSWQSGMLGVEAESLNDQLAGYFGVKQGVLVRSVAKGSAAEKAGIKAGDVITKVADTAVTSPGEVTKTIRDMRDKNTFPVTLTRDHKEMTLSVTIEAATKTSSPSPFFGPSRMIGTETRL